MNIHEVFSFWLGHIEQLYLHHCLTKCVIMNGHFPYLSQQTISNDRPFTLRGTPDLCNSTFLSHYTRRQSIQFKHHADVIIINVPNTITLTSATVRLEVSSVFSSSSFSHKYSSLQSLLLRQCVVALKESFCWNVLIYDGCNYHSRTYLWSI